MSDLDHTIEKMVKMKTIVFLGALLPGIGCYLCIAYTYIFQFEKVLNFTQGQLCHNVHNIFPPVSYSIGVWEPQRFFWLLIMFLHVPSRMFFLVLYRRLFLQSAPTQKYSWFQSLTNIFVITMWLEIGGLLMVTVFPVKFFWIHSSGYTVWITSFNFNMLFNVILHHYGGVRVQLERTFWIKVFTLLFTFSLTLSTAITFPLFIQYCSTPAYIAFSIAEYALVGLNSVYYCVVYWEFPKTRITVGIMPGADIGRKTTQVSVITCNSDEDDLKVPI